VAKTNQTVPTGDNVAAFVESIADETRRDEARLLIEVMQDVTGEQPVMWGPSIVGFGLQHLTYASGRELDNFRIGFAPRKAQTAIYLTGPLEDYADLLDQLGPHSTGKGCLYVKRLNQVDPATLRAIVKRSYEASGRR